MRSTSAAEASSMRARGRAAAAAPRDPLLASIRLHLLFVAMVPEPARHEALASFFLEYLVHEAMVLGTVASNAVQHEATALQGEGPLAHFPQFVIDIALRAHDGNLVNGGIVEADLVIDGPNGGLTRLRVSQIKAHRA